MLTNLTQLTPLPIDKLGVAKDGRFVVKAMEWQGSTQIEHVLESYG